MKTILNENDKNEIIFRLKKIQDTQKPLWGKMNAGEMLRHLIEANFMSIGQRTFPPKGNFLFRTIIKWLVFYVIPMPKNAPTAPELINLTPDPNFDKNVHELVEIIEQIFKKDRNIIWGTHPLFGKLHSKEWGVLIYKHTDHHLKQFGV